MKQFIKRNRVVLILAALCILAVTVFPSFGLIANSDSNLGVNAKMKFSKAFYIWNDIFNGGAEQSFHAFLPTLGLEVLLNRFNLAITNAGMVVLVFTGMWYLAYQMTVYTLKLESKQAKFISFLIASYIVTAEGNRIFLFAVTNVLWAMLAMYVTFYLYVRYLDTKDTLYLISTVLVFGFTFYDIATGILALIFIAIYTFVRMPFYKFVELKLFPKLLIIAVLLNAYWMSYSVATSVLGGSQLNSYFEHSSNTDSILSIITNQSSLSYAFALGRENFYASVYYKDWFKPLDIGLDFVLYGLIIVGLYFSVKEQDAKVKTNLSILYLMLIIFLTLGFGPRDPFGFFRFLWSDIPGFKIFRDFYKFHRVLQLIYLILGSYGAIKLYNFVPKKKFKGAVLGLCILFLAKLYPFYFLYPVFEPFKIPNYYFKLNEYISSTAYESQVTVFPTIAWHITLDWANQVYDMVEPFYNFAPLPLHYNGGTYFPDTNYIINDLTTPALVHGDEKLFMRLLAIRNIEFIIARDDIQDAYIKKRSTYQDFDTALDVPGFVEKLSQSSKIVFEQQFGKLYLFRVLPEHMLPLIYSPQQVLAYNIDSDLIGDVLTDSVADNFALLFSNQNYEKDIDKLEGQYNIPYLEYKKINPAKYRIRVHSATDEFPLVLARKYNVNWRVYFQAFEPQKLQAAAVYTPKNEHLSASVETLSDYINKGWVSTLGDGQQKSFGVLGYSGFDRRIVDREFANTDFVSIQVANSIQNNNLLNGGLFENAKSHDYLAESSHYTANGYANYWMINPAEICSRIACVQNSDGSVDFELVLAYWPQVFAYIGFGITFLSYTGVVGYVLIRRFRR